ncbi:class I SAM-dependent DNA methyltransferase [Lentzea nigeriaca]|uniref:class I SAM-dependent DNA methyltransferase n=1 Tax=Lentzea nigeriaca TaxID=1128665 RepID=UPI00195694A5|nr:class I SAM-dependent methyltransferase [Lentzea nigeriaca]MBM7864820.1 SAM-dependent methyltransferase [Lentzea nigeriaca]
MKGFNPSFGPETAVTYDNSPRGDEADTVRFLAGFGKNALEFAIGTGRIALPLKEAGVDVDGIELSPHMVARLREKLGNDAIDVVIGDMSRATTGRAYDLVYLVYNTITNLLTQDDQVRCFENAARHLAPGGVFVIECGLPSWAARQRHQFIDVESLEIDRVGFDVNRYDPATQILDENHVEISADGIRFGPIRQRLAYPAEFDLMARIAGLRLRDRWGGWNGEEFTAASTRHVSVYEAAA